MLHAAAAAERAMKIQQVIVCALCFGPALKGVVAQPLV
jgi:hypothetical protein